MSTETRTETRRPGRPALSIRMSDSCRSEPHLARLRAFAPGQGQRFACSGAALVITLLVLSVLTVIVIGFLSSMSTERLTSNSYAAVTQARLAAEAGVEESAGRLTGLLSSNPWHGIGVKALHGQLTPFFLGGNNTQAAPTKEEYLISRDASATGFTPANSTDLNIKRDASDTIGWIGSPVDLATSAISHRPARAHWVKILSNPQLPEQPNPKAANYNPVVARYAYWVEDETAKLDITTAGNDDNSGAFERPKEPSDPEAIDLGALPLNGLKPLDYTTQKAKDILGDILDFRDSYPGILKADPRALNRASQNYPATPKDVADSVKFHTSAFSLSNELAMTGRRRANLNHIVTSINWGSESGIPNTIAADLDDIGFVITGRHIMAAAHPGLKNADHKGVFLEQPAETGPLPNFGERFFAGAAAGFSTQQKQDIYLKQIAANIRDYIDADSQPTVVDSTGLVPAPTRPTTAPSISQPKLQAIGKEAVPFLQEHAWRGFIIPGSWTQNGTTVTANLRFDHYFELFNPSTKDYTAPAGTFLKVYNQPSWLAGSFPSLVPGDFEIDLGGVTIPAGDVRVITTNDTGQHPPNMLREPGKLIARAASPVSSVLINGARSNEAISSVRGFQLQGRSSSITDYRTEFLIGTNLGLLDYFPAMSISLSSGSPWNITNRGSNVGSQTRFVYSSSLRGNDQSSRSGDPRSLSAQLEWKDYQSGGNGDQSRFYGNIAGHSDTGSPSIPHTSTFGWASTQFVVPANWPDYHVPLNDTASSAYAVIRDEPMASIGELGHIYDPHRKITTESGADIRHARGGGRSLKVGQRDDLVPQARFGTSGATTSWFHAAWRLCDLFSAGDASKPVSEAEYRGKLNINGALRDNGVAIRALLREFVFLSAPDGDTARAGNKMTDDEVNKLVEQIINYLQTNGPMLERGELSQLEFFSGAGAGNRAGGQPGSTSIDRSREEIFRRVVELITTRSLSFSVYCVGEAIRQLPNGSLQTEARSALRRVIRLVPQTNENGTLVDLDKATAPAARATNFRVETIHESRLF